MDEEKLGIMVNGKCWMGDGRWMEDGWMNGWKDDGKTDALIPQLNHWKTAFLFAAWFSL